MNWGRVEQLFHRAACLPEQERRPFLERECSDQPWLLQEVESLLESETLSAGFLEHSALEVAAGRIASCLGESLVGCTLADYVVDRFLEAGGMASVYEAHSLQTRERVCLKVLFTSPLESSSARIRRFLREAKVLARLSHPGIPRIYGAGVCGEFLYIAMEILDGETLSRVVRKRRLEESEILHVAFEVASALDAAHARGVLHRDIKPSNIILASDGSVRLIDFGVVKRMLPDGGGLSIGLSRDSLTVTGNTVGTLDYMSPEQVAGRKLDARSDLYSLGITLFEMTTGRLPFDGGSFGEKVDQILRQPVPSAQLFCPGISDRLGSLIDTCLKKDPGERFRSAGEVCEIIRGSKRSGFSIRTILCNWRTWLLVLGLLFWMLQSLL